MTYRPHGKHVLIDEDFPEALGICDYTGFVFLRKDLVRQMEWRGNALVWTGLYVGRPYASKPNEQLRPPILPPDPVPILEPRPKQPTNVTWQNSNRIWSESQNIWVSDAGSEDGIPALPIPQRLAPIDSTNFDGYNANYGQESGQNTALDALQNVYFGGFFGGYNALLGET